jgi:hypothetical protein
MASRNHCPDDAGELIGARDRQQNAIREAHGSSFDPQPAYSITSSARAMI